MSFTFNTNITDLVKGFIGITLVILAIIYVPKVMGKLDNLGQPVDETTIERIASNVVKVHLVESNKELKKLLKELKKENNVAIEAALSNTNAKIKEIADIVGNIRGPVDTNPEIDVEYGDKDDPRRLETFVVTREDADGKEYPTGIVYYSPNASEGEKFAYQPYPLDVHATIVLSEEGEEEKRHAAMWIENNFVEGYKDKKFPVALEPQNIRWAMAKENEKKFDWWNPRLSLGSSFVTDAFYPNLGISLMSYGRTKRDMDWKFLDFSLGGNSEETYAGFTLFEYNFGNLVPLVENLFGGPNITYGISVDDASQNNVSYGLKFSVPF